MNIDKQSWHYKQIRRYIHRSDYNIPRNLCPYFRHLIGSFMVLGFLGWLGFLLGYWVLEIIGEVGCRIVYGEWISFFGSLDSPQMGVPMGLIYFVVTVSLTTGLVILDNWRNIQHRYPKYLIINTDPEDPRGVTSIGLIVGWLKAFHEGVCPHIDFYDSKKPKA